MSVTGAAEAEAFGRMIRERRRELGLRQEDIVLSTGVGRRYLIELEAGKPTARIGPALMIAGLLGIYPTISAQGAARTQAAEALPPSLEP
ncbi:helix-turn-helix domain-containing protein [Falsigemmobacter intermedius]|uniref:helix-turn-helix domain-containing protein n=1 Tax=Falsigemmobacter intermedius TaxID=1553448 RepID=UPI00157FB9DF|nr:helix-turn-helix domain-containing protein [Falsigemmobacter intermedius]